MAILSPEGEPLFGEASERFFQNKRAYHCPADDLIRLPRLINKLCPPDAELVVAANWSQAMLQMLSVAAQGAFQFSSSSALGSQALPEGFDWPMPSAELMLVGFRNSLSQAGLNLRASRRIPNEVVMRHYDHHLTHAALAAYASPFDECSVAIVDGYGENRSTSFFQFDGRALMPVPGQLWDSPAEIQQSISLGHFYGRLCAACGFDPIQGEEWKVMGLAAYGTVREEMSEVLRSLIRVEGLSLRAAGANEGFAENLRRLRDLGRGGTDVADLAATGQAVFEDLMTELLAELHRSAPSDRLALAGGCALNSSCNGRIVDRTPFRDLYVPSAPADDGCALGAALLAFADDHPDQGFPSAISSPYLGSGIPPSALENLRKFGGLGNLQRPRRELLDEVAGLLAGGKIVGWVQGRAEFGPRALGHRSILADPRRLDMKDRLNSVVKFREEFRPFAPAILDEHGPTFFESYQTSRYMERTLRFRPEKAELVPAVVHVDGTGRLQSVRREWSPLFYDLIQEFHNKTGVPILLNTSLNVMGKPIVHSIEDALGLFFTTGLDALVIEDLLLTKDSALTG